MLEKGLKIRLFEIKRNKDAELRSCGDIKKRVCELNNKTRVMSRVTFKEERIFSKVFK